MGRKRKRWGERSVRLPGKEASLENLGGRAQVLVGNFFDKGATAEVLKAFHSFLSDYREYRLRLIYSVKLAFCVIREAHVRRGREVNEKKLAETEKEIDELLRTFWNEGKGKGVKDREPNYDPTGDPQVFHEALVCEMLRHTISAAREKGQKQRKGKVVDETEAVDEAETEPEGEIEVEGIEDQFPGFFFDTGEEEE